MVMNVELVGWWLMAVLAVVCAIGMISARSPVHSALWLVGNFIALGVIYLVLSAPMLFAIQLIVYAGAIMVLFLFVVMFFMSPKARQWLRPALKGQLVLGGILAVVLLVLLVFGMSGVGTTFGEVGRVDRDRLISENIEAGATPIGNPRPLGNWLFKYHALPFELVSVLLLAAMIGALMVARDTRSEGREPVDDDDELPAAGEPNQPEVKA